ncbi:MAG: maltotransferase domain-containing protein [Ilumatobacteraceae bacterium]
MPKRPPAARPSASPACAADAVDLEARPSRLTIASFSPSVHRGAHPAKRAAGDHVQLAAVVLCDQHMALVVSVQHTTPNGAVVNHPLHLVEGPTYGAEIALVDIGVHEFVLEAWIDQAATLQSRIDRKLAAGLDADLDQQELAELSDRTTDRRTAGPFRFVVDRPVAAFGAWYEFFPRSVAVHGGGAVDVDESPSARHGTLAEAIERLPYVADLGFDIVYLPPIHPIGASHRKGANNSVAAAPDDVGSPWAIGAADGGHDAVHPLLGTHDDLVALVAAAQQLGLEVALDIAFQCSPDHPWVATNADWFHVRPDGSIAYAENPPKRYQDIVPLAFDTPAWRSLWEALADVIRVWMRLGVRTFRVDNPHTKPLAFWEWAIAELKREDPGLIFLAEAFTHPELMLELSRVGFSQSYTHFPWQYAPWQLRDYYAQMLHGEEIEHFRGAAWPNTPDILTEELQQGLRQVFVARLVLAATLNATYGVYGPAFELQQAAPMRHGSEEYLDSEKYQLRAWDLDQPGSLAPELRTINEIRRTHRALHHDRSLHFHESDNERFVVYSKTAPTWFVDSDVLSDDPILVVVNTDYWNAQDTIIHLDLVALGLADAPAIEARDLLNGGIYRWTGWHQFIRLDPWQSPAHIFALKAVHDGH